MSDNIDKMCFADLIKKGKIRIPQIQRDYAQGRKNKEVKEIRNHFVRSLLLVVTGKKAETQLDFVYGSDRKNAFEPLDGQQRLTTLFILHWVLGVDLQTAEGESILIYETRNTSEAFCKELVHHNAKQFVNEAAEKTKESKKKTDEERSKPEEQRDASKLKAHIYTPSEIIQNRDWFQWGWRFDPTINSMLVMIDTICEQMDWTLDLDACQARLNNITFNHLDLGEMGMSDELFIKMNARGKLLSDFDKLKSTLEEEIQLQQGEVNCDGKKLADSYIENSIITNIKDLEYVINNPDIRKKVKEVLRHDVSIDEVKKRLHVPIMLLHECSITKGARELSPEYLEEIKHYHLNRAERFFMSHNNKQKKEGVYGFEKIMFHLILFPVPNKENIVNWFVKRANQIKQDA